MKLTSVLFCLLGMSTLLAQDKELRFCLRHEPKTFDPLLVADDSSEAIRYLTGGVLIRINRVTQKYEGELAESWKSFEGGRRIVFKLRPGLRFSDGTAFTARDVEFTIARVMDPNLRSPTGDSFRSGAGAVRTEIQAPDRIAILFPEPIPGVERVFDQLPMMSAQSPKKELAVLGPFALESYKAGSGILLRRNTHYWKRDAAGRQLPYLDSIRIDIQQNRDAELLRFRRGEIHFIENLEPDLYERLSGETPASVIDSGASFDAEVAWWNQVRKAPIPAYKKAWFQSSDFRRALAQAVNRDDMVKLVYRGHAIPAVGPSSPSNQLWFNGKLKPHRHDPAAALKLLESIGFRKQGESLRDREGNLVEFSLITNAGNRTRARLASLMQQDLAKIGIRLNVVPLDFSSLIERITRSFDYEACLLGMVNVDLDPIGQMNVWLSSARNHQWNPAQATPETPWEAEVDKLMRVQASTIDFKKRKAAFDRVQAIAWQETPFMYLTNRNFLAAVSPLLRNVSPAAMRPQIYWNVEKLYLAGSARASR